MTDRITTVIADDLLSKVNVDLTSPFARGQVARAILAALKAARIAVVELAETQIDPEWGDEYWSVPSGYDKNPGKLRIETGYRDGVPRISITSVRTPMPITEVDAYVSALLAAKSAAEASE
ncbi:hypothetical protein A5742_31420 [Mycolicibacterium fortuitum]|uniref:Uncharacterized protein n=1 Tax=Mycolicibacterium fortuitum TaxID=1766 RepID=A0ABD6QJH0_MYCFO|nr:hypothetical protein [Mycolicibacterium fortuitum]OMC41892.1 hypothetical protein A5742_31420 [Mycolicibacterium fortuitum]